MQRIIIACLCTVLAAGCAVTGFQTTSTTGAKGAPKTSEVMFEAVSFTDVTGNDAGVVLPTNTMMTPKAVLEVQDGIIVVSTVGQEKGFLVPKDTLVTKLDANGKIIWEKRHVLTANGKQVPDMSFAPSDAMVASDGSIVVCGKSGTWQAHIPIIFKLNEQGDMLWDNHIGETGGECLGIAENLSGNYITLITTDTMTGLATTLASDDIAGEGTTLRPIYKGEEMWHGHLSRNKETNIFVAVGSSKVAGSFDKDLFIGQLHTTSKLLWTQEQNHSKFDWFPQAHPLADKNILITSTKHPKASFKTDSGLMQLLDESGKVKWQKEFSNMGAIKTVPVKDGYIVLGRLKETSDKKLDLIVFHITKNDNVKWITRLGGPNDEYPSVIKQLQDGSILVAGFRMDANGNYPKAILYKLDGETGKPIW